MHIAHGGLHIARRLSLYRPEKGIDAVGERRRRAERHEGIHIRRSVDKPFEAADEESLIYHHYRNRQQQFDQTHCGVITDKI